MNIPSYPPCVSFRQILASLLTATILALGCGLAPAANPHASWTTGHKKILIIPIRFTDWPGPSDDPSPSGYYSGWGNIVNGTETARLSAFFEHESYGKCTVEFTVLPEVDMGVSYTAYNALYGNTGLTKFTNWSEPGSLADDARVRARQAGVAAGNPALYDTDNYDLDIIICGFVPGQGTLSSGRPFGKGIFGTTAKALAHEIGHNFGCQHGNGVSRSTFYSPVKSGTFFTDAYGDVYDLMGWKDTTPIPMPLDREHNVYWKHLMNWLPDENITTATTSGTYRVYAFDQGTLETGKNYALRVVRDPARVYWFSFRQAITDAGALWSQNGLEVRIGGESMPATSGHTTMLDMTPGSRGMSGNIYATMYDAPLAIGRTYSDAEANLHITPIKKGGTTPESMDVVANFGPFPGNVAPTATISPATTASLAAGVAKIFTATASDPDGDALSYYWEFDDPDALGYRATGNTDPDARLSTQGSHTWTRNGTYTVRCTVSDMKGHATIASATVTVNSGATALYTITGTVKDENGNPLQGVVVNNYKPGAVNYGTTNLAASGETAADGKYTIHLSSAVAANYTYTLYALYKGQTFNTPLVTVNGGSRSGINFTRTRPSHTVTGYFYVAGGGYDVATYGAMSVTGAGQTVNLTPGSNSWSLTVPDGTALHLVTTPANPTCTVFTSLPDPYIVVDDYNVQAFLVNIPGQMPQTGFLASSSTSDDTAATINIPVTLTPPPGSTTWGADQSVYYWIDPASTAEYGVDYKSAGGRMAFYRTLVPTPQNIVLKILPTGVPKNKTVVFRLGPTNSIDTVGPITTYVHTISKGFAVTSFNITGNTVNLAWESTTAAHYTIQSTTSLATGAWTDVPNYINLPGEPVAMARAITTTGPPAEFYRVKVEE